MTSRSLLAVVSCPRRGGRLALRTTSDFPLLSVERTTNIDERNLVHSIEIRMRASAGSNLGVSYRSDPSLDFERVLDQAKTFPRSTTAPIIAGEEMRTYTLTPSRPVTAEGTGHLILRPCDAKGATFEIAWARVVFRREHPANLESGICWHGLSEIYRETLVSRSPETITFEIDLPERPWLDLGIGTIEAGPVSFRVGLRPDGATPDGPDDRPLLERTGTTPRWEEAPVDLSPLGRTEGRPDPVAAGRRRRPLGYWGSPTIHAPPGA